MCVLCKEDLINYMITKHRRDFNEEISPIKLQKGLYFLYAYWGGKIRKSQFIITNDEIPEMTEMGFSHYDPHLFDADFEAWAYGPVDRDVYIWFKNLGTNIKDIEQYTLTNDEYVLGYVDDLLDRIFNSNDFGLVDLSHDDRCWRDIFDPNKKNKMDNERIINEYTYK